MATDDPRVDLGSEGVVRGDPFDWTLTILADDVDGNPQPVDLTAFGDTWSADARRRPDSSIAYPFTIDDSGAASGVLVLSLTAVQTLAMNNFSWPFDLQVSGGTAEPLTLFKGTVIVSPDFTYPDAP